MANNIDVLRHLPFQNGQVTIALRTAPQGRYGGGPRYMLRQPICRVVLFRNGELAEQASFFGLEGVWSWITSELGPLMRERLCRQVGETNTQWHARWQSALACLGGDSAA